LKSHPEVHAIVCQRLLFRFVGAAEYGADFTTGAEKESGLSLDDVEVVLLGNVGFSQRRQLQQFALGHFSRDARQNIQNLQRPFGETGLEG